MIRTNIQEFSKIKPIQTFLTISLAWFSENKQPDNDDFTERKSGPCTLRKSGSYAKIYNIT